MNHMSVRSQVSRIVLASLMLAAASPGNACSPPARVDEAGFVRTHVGHLPRNAKGLVFLPPSGMPRAADFSVEVAGDSQALKLRVRRIGNSPWVRVEPVNGFRPGARYQFRYLPAHRPWRHPDTQAVTIDALAVDTAGRYAIEPAPRALHRVVTVPTSMGSCTKPAPVLLHAFSHAVPAGLTAYRDALEYEVHELAVEGSRIERMDPLALEWGPQSRPSLLGWMSWPDRVRHGPRDAVIAPCGNRWNRVRMRSSVAFPELDDRRHATREVVLDFSRGAGGECGELEALVQTMHAGSPEAVLREACRLSLGWEFSAGEISLAGIPVEHWERSLSFPYIEMGPTCDLVALAYLWRSSAREPAPADVDKIAAALQAGFAISDAARRERIVHALAYLLGQLPDRYRRTMAPRLAQPLLPLLVEEFGAPRPRRPDRLAQLIAAAGRPPDDLRARLVAIAAGTSTAAPYAQGILDALPR